MALQAKFAFTADDYHMFEICFISRVPAGQQATRHEVFLLTKHGVEAKSYDNLGDAAKLKPMEVGVVKPVGFGCWQYSKRSSCRSS